MYAEGFSKDAKLFNCVQRGHQHALETYTQFVVLSALGGLKYPITTVLGGLLWFVARVQWAEGYKTGEPSKRYQSWLAYGIWTSIITVMAAALGTAAAVMM
jgi:glutathione S-transferase